MNTYTKNIERKLPIVRFLRKNAFAEPQYNLIALEVIKGKISNPIKDIQSRRANKEKVISILKITFDMGIIEEKFYNDSLEKISKINS